MGLIVSAMPTGWGDRFISMLYAMYTAEKHNWKFGFRWEVGGWKCDDTVNVKNVEIENKDFIFSKDFIDKFHYDKISLFNNSMPYMKTTSFIKKSHYWGLYTFIILPEEHNNNCVAYMPILWKQIQFSEQINELLKQTNNLISNKVGENYISIHIRSGDIVYHRYHSINFHWSNFRRAGVIEIFMEIIKKNKDKTIILFGDDIDALYKLKNYYRNLNYDLYLAKEILPAYDNDTMQTLQEIFLISKAKKIISSSYSAFARLPSFISMGKENEAWQDYFSDDEKLKILNSNFGKIDLSNEQKAFSKLHTYIVHKKLYPNDWNTLADIISTALKYMPSNILYHLLLIESYIKLNKIDKANNQTKEMLFSGHIDEISSSFNLNMFSSELKKTFAKKFDKKYSYLNLVSSAQ